jgi:hypothetical protein
MARCARRRTHLAVGRGTQKRVEGNSLFERGSQGNCGFKRRSFDQPGRQGHPIRNDESRCEVYMQGSPQQACASRTGTQDCVVRSSLSTSTFHKSPENASLLRSTMSRTLHRSAIGRKDRTFRIDVLVGLAEVLRKYSIELKRNLCH